MFKHPTKLRFVAVLVLLTAMLCGVNADTYAKTIRLKAANAKTIDVNVIIHGNVGMTQDDAEELAEKLLKAAKLAVIDAGDGPDVLEVTMLIEADDDDDDDDGIPDAKDNDDDGDGEDDSADHDEDNDGKGFHITIEVEGGWHIDGDSDLPDGVDDEIADIMDDVIEHLKGML